MQLITNNSHLPTYTKWINLMDCLKVLSFIQSFSYLLLINGIYKSLLSIHGLKQKKVPNQLSTFIITTNL